jgi:hypothetical protein
MQHHEKNVDMKKRFLKNVLTRSVSLFMGLIFVSTVLLTACGSSNYVENEFKWIHDVLPGLGDPLQQEKELYAVYQLTDEQIEKLLAMRFTKQGYSDWQDFTERACLGISTPLYHLDGIADQIKFCLKQGSDDYNKIAIYVDLKPKKLILLDGITYGR